MFQLPEHLKIGSLAFLMLMIRENEIRDLHEGDLANAREMLHRFSGNANETAVSLFSFFHKKKYHNVEEEVFGELVDQLIHKYFDDVHFQNEENDPDDEGMVIVEDLMSLEEAIDCIVERLNHWFPNENELFFELVMDIFRVMWVEDENENEIYQEAETYLREKFFD